MAGARERPEPERRLKVGYVSPDFRRHSTRHFLLPLLAHHDRSRYEIVAYAELAKKTRSRSNTGAMSIAGKPPTA